MLSPNETYVQAARRKELERAAAHAAQLATARALNKNVQAVHAQALSKVGDMLVTVGSRLQDRYGTLIEEAGQTPAEAC